jgi:hypothetical protein
MVAGDMLPETWQAAVETLLVLDEICATFSMRTAVSNPQPLTGIEARPFRTYQ